MPPSKIFISYSHRDEEEKDHLVSHLGVLASEGLLDLWVDDRLAAGGDWESEIGSAMDQAALALLLVTRHFLNSRFILGTEVPTLLRARTERGLVVIPIIARPCAWQRVGWLARMNVQPKNGAPVWRDQGAHADEELARIAEQVARILERKPARVRPPAPVSETDPTPDSGPSPGEPGEERGGAMRVALGAGLELDQVEAGDVTGVEAEAGRLAAESEVEVLQDARIKKSTLGNLTGVKLVGKPRKGEA